MTLRQAAPPAPRLASHYRSSPRVPLSFHGLQYLGGVVLIGSAGAMAVGGLLSTVSLAGPAVIAGASAGSVLASISFLGAAGILRADGHSAPLWPGLMGVGLGLAGAVGLLAPGLPYLPSLALAPLAVGSLVFSTVGFVSNGRVARQANASLAIVPLREGAMPVLSMTF